MVNNHHPFFVANQQGQSMILLIGSTMIAVSFIVLYIASKMCCLLTNSYKATLNRLSSELNIKDDYIDLLAQQSNARLRLISILIDIGKRTDKIELHKNVSISKLHKDSLSVLQ